MKGQRRQQPELFVEAVHPAIGGGKTVVGDGVPDFEDVGPARGRRVTRGI